MESQRQLSICVSIFRITQIRVNQMINLRIYIYYI